MTIDQNRIADLCRTHDIVLLRVFGSVARGEDREGSDVDLLVRFGKRKSLIDLIGIEEEFEQALGRRVDLVTEAALSPFMRDRVLQEARVIYERAA
ncbi:MAG: type VII toxin-antitoxin system MntA family adenylyltransferase antitoxin [Pseudomonas sp.]